MRRKAAAGREVLYLSQQPFEDPPASGLVPLGSYPLRSSMLDTATAGRPDGDEAPRRRLRPLPGATVLEAG